LFMIRIRQDLSWKKEGMLEIQLAQSIYLLGKGGREMMRHEVVDLDCYLNVL